MHREDLQREAQRRSAAEALRTREASWALFAAFVLEIFLLSPLVGTGTVPQWVQAMVGSATLLLAAVALHGRRGAVVFALVALALVGRWVEVVGGGARSATLFRAAVVTFTLGTFAALYLANVFGRGRVPDRLLSALLAYLFLGGTWAGAYELMEALHPGALSMPGPAPHAASDFVYFSYTTLTSVGFGDVVAVHPLARSLAVLEALTGQLFLVLVVSRFAAEGTDGRGGGEARDRVA